MLPIRIRVNKRTLRMKLHYFLYMAGKYNNNNRDFNYLTFSIILKLKRIIFKYYKKYF